MRTGSYYRVDLTNGITVEDRPTGFYRNSDEMGRTVFTSMRQAKAAFARSSRSEIDRLRTLQRKVRPLATLADLKAHSYSAEPPEA